MGMNTIVILIFILRIALVCLLFGFLYWTVSAIWRDLRTQGRLVSTPIIPTLVITRIQPEDMGENTPVAFPGPEIIIGRSPSNECPIADETVSARHARLSYHHNQWWVEDFRSTNGTFINDERVSVPTVIVSGDELRVGQVSLLIAISDKDH